VTSALGVRADTAATQDIVETLRRECRPGDLVVIMSNGGFDDIHRKSCRPWRRLHERARIVAAGDAAWLIELENRIDPAVNARASRLRGRARGAVGAVRDSVTGYRSVAVYVDR